MTNADGPSPAPAPESEFTRLVKQLARDPKQFWADPLEALGERVHISNDAIFDSYCRGAVRLVRSKQVDAAALESMLDEYGWICGPDIDAQDYVTDLLRIVAAEIGRPDLLRRATVEHLDTIQRLIVIHTDCREFRKALRAGQRGLTVLEESGEGVVDRTTHAMFLAAIGRAHLTGCARRPNPADFPPDVLRSLGVDPRMLGPQYEYDGLEKGVAMMTGAVDLLSVSDRKELGLELSRDLPQFAWPLVHRAAMAGMAREGLATSMKYLETAAGAGRAAGDLNLFALASIQLASRLSEVRLSARGEEVLRALLADPRITQGHRTAAEIQLASALSEQSRYEDAATLQRSLLDQPEAGLSSDERATLLFNFGNSLLMLGQEEAATRSWNDALELIRSDPKRAELSGLEGRIHTILAERHFAAGRVRPAEKELALAEAHFAGREDVAALEFNSRAANGLFLAGEVRKAIARLERSEQLLEAILTKEGPAVWESLFKHSHLVPAQTIEIRLTRERDKEAPRRALVAAEAAKGRLLGWLRLGPTADGAKLALSASRREQIVDKVVEWAGAASGRLAISLFGTDRGLAVMNVGAGGSIRGRWLDEVPYQTFMTDVYEPWAELIDSSATGEKLAIWAGTATELLLERIGALLSRACPALTRGGQDLVISSHRLFRSLPLSHCRLPGGRRLGELFDRVLIVSSFADLAEAFNSPSGVLGSGVVALADPDGTLPFARLEGLLSTGGQDLRLGHDVTVPAVREALSRSGTVLLSCHGVFDPSNPWSSVVVLADGQLPVAQLFESAHARHGLLLLLGACESGRNRRSLSDEPLGFPAAFIHAGADAVLAPMWGVDDFSACLYLTRYVSLIREGVHAATAVQRASSWLRDLRAADALEQVDEWRTAMGRSCEQASWSDVSSQLDVHAAWLRLIDANERPFRSARDWAAFQLIGVPPGPPN